ncbi:unnamed protein product [Clavelina lepadiformis]|uniref:exodeoxyribonuclease III n=1 Tax=Clavelina lepadiformis TaxID=159417 RepID=A0ABP0G8E8_CLALP
MFLLRILSLNCNGLRKQDKRAFVYDLLRTKNVDVALLQETHSSPGDEIQWTKEWGKRALWNSGNTQSRGLAILINNKHIEVKSVNFDNFGRVLATDISVFGESMHIVNVYAPVRGSGNECNTQDRFYDGIYPYVHSKLPTLLAGDFNCVDDRQKDRNNFMAHQVKRYESKSLKDLCETYGLKDLYRISRPNGKDFT